jgi:hypothetical protein
VQLVRDPIANADVEVQRNARVGGRSVVRRFCRNEIHICNLSQLDMFVMCEWTDNTEPVCTEYEVSSSIPSGAFAPRALREYALNQSRLKCYQLFKGDCEESFAVPLSSAAGALITVCFGTDEASKHKFYCFRQYVPAGNWVPITQGNPFYLTSTHSSGSAGINDMHDDGESVKALVYRLLITIRIYKAICSF